MGGANLRDVHPTSRATNLNVSLRNGSSGWARWLAPDSNGHSHENKILERETRRERDTLAMNLEAQVAPVSLVPQLDISHHDCPILLSVAIRGQPSGPAGRPITVVPLKPKAGLARPGPGRASPTDRWNPNRASATGRPTEKQPPPHRGPTPESSGPHARTRQPG